MIRSSEMMKADAPAAGEPLRSSAFGQLDEDSTRALCLVRACESGAEDAALWSPEDAGWASRLADETVAADAGDADWLAARARHALQRILPRRPSLARAFARRSWGLRWLVGAAATAFVLGLLADLVGAGQVINLLAAPVWSIVAWNLLVYLWIAFTAWRARGSVPPAGPLRRTVQRWFGAALGDAERARTPEQRFAASWARVTAPLAASRAALLLHLAALALALGLLAGLYARALVLDYRVGWQSTLLDPAQVQVLLSTLLHPAALLTGIAVPGLDAVTALRTDASGLPVAGGVQQALPWLHLLAATLAWAVLVPRALLALHAAGRAWHGSRHVTLPIDDAASMKLLLGRRRGGAAKGPSVVQVLPHGFAPTPAATLALRTLLAAQFGGGVELQAAATTAYGDEEKDAALAPPPGTAWRVAWFDLSATPELQAQGRFVAELLALSPITLTLLVDESAYRQRMGAASPRLAERRQAWQAFADEAGVKLQCADLAGAAPEPAAAAP